MRTSQMRSRDGGRRKSVASIAGRQSPFDAAPHLRNRLHDGHRRHAEAGQHEETVLPLVRAKTKQML